MVKTEKAEYFAKTVIIATGADANWLNLPSEQKLRGQGRFGLRHMRRIFL